MFQNSDKSNLPGQPKVPQTPDAKQLAVQAGEMAVDKAADAVGGKVKEVKDKAQQAQQTGQQAMAYANTAQQAADALLKKRESSAGVSPVGQGINGNSGMGNSGATGGAGNAGALAASEMLGVSHMAQLTIVVEGTQIKHYKHFSLSQSAIGHHNFSLILANDALGNEADHQMEDAQKLLGKRITVTFTFKNIEGGPERDFIGVVTQVGYSREFGNKGNVVLSGNSPTILMDAAPHIQSFGGKSAIALKKVAEDVFKESLGDKYQFLSDPNFSGNISYACQYDETHYNFLARTAEAYGEQFFYDGKTLYFGKMPEGEKPLELTFGKDVDEIDIQMKTQHVKRQMYGYNSTNNEMLSTGETKITHKSSLAKDAYDISEKTFIAPSLRIAPLKAGTGKDVEAAQKSATGSQAVNVLTTSGRTSVPFLYPGCLVNMNMRKADSKDSSYFTKLMITKVNHSVDALGNYVGYFEAIAADTGFLPTPVFKTPIAEPQIATVTDNADNKGRVQVKFDWQMGDSTSEWIRVMSPDAGGSEKVSSNRGLVTIPEIGDSVMVGFVHSHPDRPYVMGALFHGKVGGGGGSGNNIKSLSSKSGHTVQLDDGGGITVRDKAGNSMILDGGGNITATSSASNSTTVGKGGEAKMTMDSGGNISIEGTTKIEFKVGGSSITITPDTIALAADNNTVTGTSNTITGTNHITGGDTKIDGGNAFIN